MNILCVMPWYPANAARFLADAFEAFGHRIFRCGPTYFDHYGISYQPSELPLIHLRIQRRQAWNLDEYIQHAGKYGFSTDMVFLSEEGYDNVIVPTEKVHTVLWSADGWPNCYRRKDTIRPSLAYTNHPLGVNPHPLTATPDGWKFLPGGFDSKWHSSIGIGSEYPLIDFCLAATMYGKRPELCHALRAAGLTVHDRNVGPIEYRQVYNNARYTYHNANGQHEIKWRFFEAAAMGCVNICDENLLLDALGFEPWEDYIPIWRFDPQYDADGWPTAASLLRVIRHTPLAQWEHIREHVRTRVLGSDSYLHRAKQILYDLHVPLRDEHIELPHYDTVLRAYVRGRDQKGWK